MMWKEFEEIAGYEVSYKDYTEIIEPMYLAIPESISKQEFVKMINRKRFEAKAKKELVVKKMLVRDRSGYEKTPNGCYYHIQYVELVGVRFCDGKFIVAPLSDEARKELVSKGIDLNLGYDFDMDYTRCIDKKTNKPVELNWD